LYEYLTFPFWGDRESRYEIEGDKPDDKCSENSNVIRLFPYRLDGLVRNDMAVRELGPDYTQIVSTGYISYGSDSDVPWLRVALLPDRNGRSLFILVGHCSAGRNW